MTKLEDEILEHIGKRLTKLNIDRNVKSKLEQEKCDSALNELHLIVKIFQNYLEKDK